MVDNSLVGNQISKLDSIKSFHVWLDPGNFEAGRTTTGP